MEVEPDTNGVSEHGGPPLVPVTLKKVKLKINMCMGYGEPGDSNGPVHRTVDHAGDLLGAVHNQHPRPIVGHAAADVPGLEPMKVCGGQTTTPHPTWQPPSNDYHRVS